MHRWLWLLCAAGALAGLDASTAWAQNPWPEFGLDANPISFPRGPGHYLALWKIGLAWGLFAFWVWTTDWVSRDCQQRGFDYSLWNSVAFFPLVVAFLLLWILPWFLVGFLLMLLAASTPLGVYIHYRNQRVDPDKQVLTRVHLRRWLARNVNKVGMKMAEEKAGLDEQGPSVTLTARGAASDRDNSVNLLTARQSPGYLFVRELLDDAVKRRADAIALEFSEQAVGVKYQIDGVWHNYAQQDRQRGDLSLAVMKTLAALKPDERRAKQAGAFGAELAGEKLTCKLTSQGTPSGETALVVLGGRKVTLKTLDDLGMRPKMQEQLMELLERRRGMALFTALPAGGLTTTIDAALEKCDRYLRSFVEVCEETRPERDLENIPHTTYSAAAGETPATVLPKLIRTYPDAIVVRDPLNAAALGILCDQTDEDNHRFVFISIRAKEAIEGLLRVLLLKVPPAKFAGAMTLVLNQRLVRKLCEKCREAYAPPPEVLKQLGLPAGRIEAFYRPPTQPIDPKNPEKVCEHCLGIGYYGRTAIFELLLVDETMRKILATTPKIELLRDAARKAKHRTLLEEGILLVAKGVTSLPELQRVLKQ